MLKNSGNPGSVVAQGPRLREGWGSFSIAVHGGSPDFYWNSPKQLIIKLSARLIVFILFYSQVKSLSLEVK